MTHPPLAPPIYCDMPLERDSGLREERAWIRRQREGGQARILPLWRNRNWARQGVDLLARRRRAAIPSPAS